jgi:hypothetical protein
MAHIIPFPNSAAAPVEQRRGPGRYPKTIVPASELRRLRYQRAQRLKVQTAPALPGLPAPSSPAEALDQASRLLQTFTLLRAEALNHYRSLHRQAQGVASSAGATLYRLPINALGAAV